MSPTSLGRSSSGMPGIFMDTKIPAESFASFSGDESHSSSDWVMIDWSSLFIVTLMLKLLSIWVLTCCYDRCRKKRGLMLLQGKDGFCSGKPSKRREKNRDAARKSRKKQTERADLLHEVSRL